MEAIILKYENKAADYLYNSIYFTLISRSVHHSSANFFKAIITTAPLTRVRNLCSKRRFETKKKFIRWLSSPNLKELA